jgi:branched-chain amino acid transport system permease protein
VVALPAIRLGGLYFALATAAFAMLMDEWIFVLREPFDLGPFTIKIFPSGFASVPRADLPGAGSDAGLLVLLSVVFALLYLLVVMVRRSTLGQRLLAMKESPAASATIGMNITATKFVVFTLSAAMAGLGGALYGGTLGAEAGSVTPAHFDFFQSLPLLLLGVVGGIGSAAGALLAGLMLGGMPMLIDTWPWMENVSRVLPGTMGVALGRNPNGIVHDLRTSFAPVARVPLALATTLAATAAVLVLRLVELIDGWTFVGLLMVAVALGPALVRLQERRAAGPAPVEPGEPARAAHDAEAEAGARDVPLEWVGIERPFTPDDVVALDRALGLETVRSAP